MGRLNIVFGPPSIPDTRITYLILHFEKHHFVQLSSPRDARELPLTGRIYDSRKTCVCRGDGGLKVTPLSFVFLK